MNIEKKFRTWDKRKKLIDYNPDYNSISEKLNDSFNWNEYIIELQYTGLKDKNKKEIYEGDIVRFYRCEDKKGMVWLSLYEDYREWIGVYGFEDGQFCITKKKYIGKSKIDNMYNADEKEIIGNIYEDKNLLK